MVMAEEIKTGKLLSNDTEKMFKEWIIGNDGRKYD